MMSNKHLKLQQTASLDLDASEMVEEDEVDEAADLEDNEPKLKYHRVGLTKTDLPHILDKDSISCMAVHPKFLVIGTRWGRVYIMDHQGNNIESKEITAHSTIVNHIDVDEKGEFLASCSDDMRVVVYNIYSKKPHYTMKLERPIFSVALCPNFGVTHNFVTGDDRLILVEPGLFNTIGLKGNRNVKLHEGEGTIRTISWRGSCVAWSNDTGVKVYCMLEKRRFTNVPREKDETDPTCKISWISDVSFALAWTRRVKICNIAVDNSNAKYAQIVCTFPFATYISGIHPFGQNLAILSCTEKQLPQLNLVEPSSGTYVGISTEDLQVRGFDRYHGKDYSFHHLKEDNSYFVVCPKDVICAQQRDRNDHIQWLLEKSRFQEALTDIITKGETSSYNKTTIGIKQLNHLISEQRYEEAALLAQNVLTTQAEWEDLIFQFHKLNKINFLATHIPIQSPMLNSDAYDLVLNDVLNYNIQEFKTLLYSWSSNLYSVPAMTQAVGVKLEHHPGDVTLLTCLAKLYEFSGQYEKTLHLLLQLHSPEVLTLIKKHNLYKSIVDKLLVLLKMEEKDTLTMLVQQDQLSVHEIVAHLKGDSRLLCAYLDAVYAKDPQRVVKYYDEMVKMYATFARQKLLPFLRSANDYSLTYAVELCLEYMFIPEAVFLLARVGRRSDALNLILEGQEGIKATEKQKVEDYAKAVQFCREQNDPLLWNYIVKAASNKPLLVTALLHNSGMDIDPAMLINNIQPGMSVPGLRDSIVKLLNDYRVQVALATSCQSIMFKDCAALLNKYQIDCRKPTTINPDQNCHRCNQRLVTSKKITSNSDIVIFGCSHSFHVQCTTTNFADVNTEIYECPVCTGLC